MSQQIDCVMRRQQRAATVLHTLMIGVGLVLFQRSAVVLLVLVADGLVPS
jgi:hypothetical protein